MSIPPSREVRVLHNEHNNYPMGNLKKFKDVYTEGKYQNLEVLI